ncbi:MAG: hypothetical protein R3C10_02355 [Pirellulales bacterium]
MQLFLWPTEWLLVKVGTVRSIGTWSPHAEFAWSLFIAVLWGLLAAAIANNNVFHSIMYRMKVPCVGIITRRTSLPSEWYAAFSAKPRYVVLHLKGRRRLYGWPFEWPDSPSLGHFRMVGPEWILPDNTRVIVELVEESLISVDDVEMVEFLSEQLPSLSRDQIHAARRRLIERRDSE